MDYKERAIELHKNNIVVDSHLDLAGEIYNRYRAGERQIIKNYYLENFKKGGFNLIISSLFIDDLFLPEMALRVALGQIRALIEDIEDCQDEVILVKIQGRLKEGSK